MKNVMWRTYRIFKDGKDTEREVSFWYHKFKKWQLDEKDAQLHAEYPESEGYKLIFVSDEPDDDEPGV